MFIVKEKHENSMKGNRFAAKPVPEFERNVKQQGRERKRPESRIFREVQFFMHFFASFRMDRKPSFVV